MISITCGDRRRWADDIKMDLTIVVCEGTLQEAEDESVSGSYERGNEL
jgi:hypothetical protein